MLYRLLSPDCALQAHQRPQSAASSGPSFGIPLDEGAGKQASR